MSAFRKDPPHIGQKHLALFDFIFGLEINQDEALRSGDNVFGGEVDIGDFVIDVDHEVKKVELEINFL